MGRILGMHDIEYVINYRPGNGKIYIIGSKLVMTS